MRQSAALLHDLLRRGGITLVYAGTAEAADGVGITLQADGGAFIRCLDPARVSAIAADAVMSALYDRLAAAAAMVGAVRSLTDAVVLLGAVTVAGLGGMEWDTLIWPAAVTAVYAVLTPLRGRLLQLLLRFALRRAVHAVQ